MRNLVTRSPWLEQVGRSIPSLTGGAALLPSPTSSAQSCQGMGGMGGWMHKFLEMLLERFGWLLPLFSRCFPETFQVLRLVFSFLCPWTHAFQQ